jgi:transposase
MTAVRLRGNDYRQRAIEVHRRHLDGELIKDIADDYNAHPDVVGRWIKHGRRYDAPNMDDRDGQRTELNGILWAEILEATEADDPKALVPLVDRLTKMNGLDHSHRVQEAQLHLDAARIRLMAERMGKALDAAGVPPDQQIKVLELVAGD